jgi:hypothetical protein
MTSPSSPTNRFLDKFFQNYEKAITENVLLRQENAEIRSTYEKQQRKKRKAEYIPQGGAARRVRRDETQQESNIRELI